MICQYCGGENVSTEAPAPCGHGAMIEAVRAVYWQNYRGIGKSSEAVEFTDALGNALGEYKGDGSNG